jgi:uncharacterized delta-60 repeat protein
VALQFSHLPSYVSLWGKTLCKIKKTAYINLENGKLNYSFKKGGFMTKLLLIFISIFFFALPLFAQSVDTAWVRRYNGPISDYDAAKAIVVDSSGNVYVTGGSKGSGTDWDYATIKYNSNGDTAWVRRYNGPSDSTDSPQAIAVDVSGNVYVTGGSYGGATRSDYATIKYFPNGDTAWVRRYNGPSNDYDYANALATDGSGNVYVTGTIVVSYENYDYATIKYYPDGDTAWVRSYNGPGNGYDYASAITVDDSGNVYVTGSSVGSGTSYDYAIIKYYPNGNTAWVKRYNGPGNSEDWTRAVALDSSGNVYVTGGSDGITTSLDYATIKYKPNGDTAWVRRYNGPENLGDYAFAITVDGSGNVYVAGVSYGDSTSNDYVTIKCFPNGDTVWVRRYNGPENGFDWSWTIAVDGSGNVYVAGYSMGSGTDFDYCTIKYDSSGNECWVRRYNSPDNLIDQATALAVDGSGSVYITGFSQQTSGYYNYDYATIKYVQFLRGDANKDSKVSLADIVYLINYLFKFGPTPEPIQSGDANCDGKVSLGDIVYLINYLFKFGPAPCI